MIVYSKRNFRTWHGYLLPHFAGLISLYDVFLVFFRQIFDLCIYQCIIRWQFKNTNSSAHCKFIHWKYAEIMKEQLKLVETVTEQLYFSYHQKQENSRKFVWLDPVSILMIFDIWKFLDGIMFELGVLCLVQ